MILNFDKPKSGILTVPVMNKQGIVTKTLVLSPGHNEISNEDWELIEPHLKDQIENGFIKPVAKLVENKVDSDRVEKIQNKLKEVEETINKTEDKKEKKELEKEKKELEEALSKVKKKDKLQPVSLEDLDSEEASKIVQDTFNLETLRNWKKSEGRESVRVSIMNQIEEIEKPGK